MCFGGTGAVTVGLMDKDRIGEPPVDGGVSPKEIRSSGANREAGG